MATNHKINVDDLFAALLVIGLLYLINSAISKKHHAAGISNLGITIQADSAYCGMVPAKCSYGGDRNVQYCFWVSECCKKCGILG